MSVSIFPTAIFHPLLCAALKLFCNTQVFSIIFIIMKWDKTLLRYNQSHSWKQEVVHLFSVTKKGCDTRLHRQIWPLWEGDQRVEVNNSFPLMGCLKLLQVSVSVWQSETFFREGHSNPPTYFSTLVEMMYGVNKGLFLLKGLFTKKKTFFKLKIDLMKIYGSKQC